MLNLWADPETIAQVDELQKCLGTYKSEVLRRAIAEMHERYEAGQYNKIPLEERVAELEKRLVELESIPPSTPKKPREPKPAEPASSSKPSKSAQNKHSRKDEDEKRDAIIWQSCRVYTTDPQKRTKEFKAKVAEALNAQGFVKRYGGAERPYDAKAVDNRITELSKKDEGYLERISNMQIDLGNLVDRKSLRQG